MVERRRKSDRASALIDEARSLPGFENFLRARPYSTLACAAEKGPVVVLISHEGICEAIVTAPHTSDPIRVPLPGVTFDGLTELGDHVKASNLRYRSAVEEEQRGIKSWKRGSSKPATSPQESSKPAASGKKVDASGAVTGGDQPSSLDGEKILERLWQQIVWPVINCLGWTVSASSELPGSSSINSHETDIIM